MPQNLGICRFLPCAAHTLRYLDCTRRTKSQGLSTSRSSDKVMLYCGYCQINISLANEEGIASVVLEMFGQILLSRLPQLSTLRQSDVALKFTIDYVD